MNKEIATNELMTGIIGYPKEVLKEFETILLGKLVKAQKDLLFLLGVTVNENSTDGTGYSFEVVEKARESQSKDENSIFVSKLVQLINNIERALTRIKLGTYGIDQKTKQLIPKERLRAQPLATMSLQTKILDKRQKELEFIQKTKGGVIRSF